MPRGQGDPAPGQPSGPPVIPCRGGSIGNNTEVGLSQIIDASFGSARYQSLYRGPSGWLTQTAVGPFVIDFFKTGSLSVATDVTSWRIVPTPWTVVSTAISVKTMPVGANLIVDVLYSTDNGTTFTTIFPTTAHRPTIIAGLQPFVFAYLESDDVSVFAANTLLRLDVIQVGSGTAGADLSLTLFGNASVQTHS